MDAPLKNAIALIGGPAAVAALFGISSQAVSQWKTAPYDRVLGIAEATDWRVTPHQLRPDLYPNAGDGIPPCHGTHPERQTHGDRRVVDLGPAARRPGADCCQVRQA
jgi:DNA-binding transcriptional regulator YdaS (Cro superfamily)